jgi:hypothetical protein
LIFLSYGSQTDSVLLVSDFNNKTKAVSTKPTLPIPLLNTEIIKGFTIWFGPKFPKSPPCCADESSELKKPTS